MLLRQPISTLTDTLCPYTPVFRSKIGRGAVSRPFLDQTSHLTLSSTRRTLRAIQNSLRRVVFRRGRRFSPTPVGEDDDQRSWQVGRSEEHTSELQSLMRNSYAVFCLKKINERKKQPNSTITQAKTRK